MLGGGGRQDDDSGKPPRPNAMLLFFVAIRVFHAMLLFSLFPLWRQHQDVPLRALARRERERAKKRTGERGKSKWKKFGLVNEVIFFSSFISLFSNHSLSLSSSLFSATNDGPASYASGVYLSVSPPFISHSYLSLSPSSLSLTPPPRRAAGSASGTPGRTAAFAQTPAAPPCRPARAPPRPPSSAACPRRARPA